jgi:hypothetical protein
MFNQETEKGFYCNDRTVGNEATYLDIVSGKTIFNGTY